MCKKWRLEINFENMRDTLEFDKKDDALAIISELKTKKVVSIDKTTTDGIKQTHYIFSSKITYLSLYYLEY